MLAFFHPLSANGARANAATLNRLNAYKDESTPSTPITTLATAKLLAHNAHNATMTARQPNAAMDDEEEEEEDVSVTKVVVVAIILFSSIPESTTMEGLEGRWNDDSNVSTVMSAALGAASFEEM